MSNQRRYALIGRGFGSDSFNQATADYVGSILADSSEIDFTYTAATPSIAAALKNASVTFARLQNADALSVLGRASNSAGVLDEIVASANDHVLARTSDSLAFQQLTVGMFPDAVVTFAKLQNADAVSVLGRSANSSGVLDEIAAGANDRILRRTSDTINFGQLTAGMFPNTVVPDAALSSNVPLLNASNTFTSTTPLILSSTGPRIRFVETDGGTDDKVWEWIVEGEQLRLRLQNDAINSSANVMVFERTDNVGDSLTLTMTNLLLGTTKLTSNYASADSNDPGIILESTRPCIRLEDTDISDERWLWQVNGESFRMDAINDAGTTLSNVFLATQAAGEIEIVALLRNSSGNDSLRVDQNSTSGNTRLLIWDVDNATLARVSVGAADSGGAGFKVLRIPN